MVRLRLFALSAVPALMWATAALPASSSPARPAAAASPQEGQAVFQQRCVMCHAVQPGVKIVGPSLAGVLRGVHASNTRAVRTTILNGKGQMPPQRDKLTDAELADLLAYLRTL